MTNPLRGILVATDGSEGAARAEGVACAIASACKCKLVILTISRGLSDVEIRRLAHIEGDIGKARHVLIERILGEATARASEAGVAEVRPITEPGDPATTILAVAAREQIDLIVIGKRGVGALSRIAFGSVSRSVTDHASCAVAVVP